MDICTSFSLDPERASQAELDAAWLALGAYKLRLRQVAPSDKILPELRRCNNRITELWDEMLKRQINSWYYDKPEIARTGPPPHWEKAYNFMRWSSLPTIFDGWKTL